MLLNINQTHKNYINFLLSSPIHNHHDYKAGASLLFLFPYYVQVGLAQIFYVLEDLIVDEFRLNITIEKPIKTIELSYSLLDRPLSPLTYSILSNQFDISLYNKSFGIKVEKDLLIKNTKTIIESKVGIIGQSSLSYNQNDIFPRDRLIKFFNQVNFQMDNLDKFIDIAINNNRSEAMLIYCQYFKYPTNLTQELINKVETWIINN